MRLSVRADTGNDSISRLKFSDADCSKKLDFSFHLTPTRLNFVRIKQAWKHWRWFLNNRPSEADNPGHKKCIRFIVKVLRLGRHQPWISTPTRAKHETNSKCDSRPQLRSEWLRIICDQTSLRYFYHKSFYDRSHVPTSLMMASHEVQARTSLRLCCVIVHNTSSLSICRGWWFGSSGKGTQILNQKT